MWIEAQHVLSDVFSLVSQRDSVISENLSTQTFDNPKPCAQKKQTGENQAVSCEAIEKKLHSTYINTTHQCVNKQYKDVTVVHLIKEINIIHVSA